MFHQGLCKIISACEATPEGETSHSLLAWHTTKLSLFGEGDLPWASCWAMALILAVASAIFCSATFCFGEISSHHVDHSLAAQLSWVLSLRERRINIMNVTLRVTMLIFSQRQF